MYFFSKVFFSVLAKIWKKVGYYLVSRLELVEDDNWRKFHKDVFPANRRLCQLYDKTMDEAKGD
jgi:hypothetical protein